MRALVESTWVRLTQPRKLRCAKPAIAVGGSVLGGTGKTPLAIAIARRLAPRVRVAIVGHAHRASPERARVVREDDRLEEVGDEAIVCARRVPTVVGPTRQSAIDLACSIADVVIIDGVLQLASPRAVLSVLTVPDTGAPAWLERDADVVEHVRSTTKLELDGLAGKRVGLVTCVARPERIVRALEESGARIAVHHAFRDHGPAKKLVGDVDVWVASEKCALHVRGEPVHVLAHEVLLSPTLGACLDRLAPPPYSEIPRT